MVGKTISHYKIVEKLGKGGMGVVYKAQDTLLERLVALKVPAPHALQDEEQKQRFFREAKAAAALDHPNICTVYEIGEADGRMFIAMAYIEGESIKQKLEGRPFRLEEAVDIATQTAEGLQAAHEKLVFHRDIKSANIMVTPRGQAKIMDFGLAQLGGHAKLTKTGATLGTPAYMSPEQALGCSTDQRTDIWSLGVVFYEMVTGQLPFPGEFAQAVLYSIVNEEPEPLTALRAGVPIEWERVVIKTLAKDPKERYQHFDELLVDLRALEKERSAATIRTTARSAGSPLRKPRRKHAAVAALLGLLSVGAGLGLLSLRPRTQPPSAPPTTVQLTSFSGREAQPALSPDGKYVAFSWMGETGDNFDIYVQQLGTGALLQVSFDPASDAWPVWSPNGRYIAFTRGYPDERRGRDVLVVPSLGGTERRLGSFAPNATHGEDPLDWSPDGKFLAVVDRGSPLEPSSIFLLSAESGEKRKITEPPGHFLGDTSPAFSPDGMSLAFVRRADWGSDDVYAMAISENGASPAEPKRLTFEEQFVQGLVWAPRGDSVIFGSHLGGRPGLWRIAISGGKPERLGVGGDYPSISDDGSLLAYQQTVTDENIWRAPGPLGPSPKGEAAFPTKFISSTRDDLAPQYSLDGKKIAFASKRSGFLEIWTVESDGSNPVQVTRGGGCPRWSADGRYIVFCQDRDVYIVSSEGGGSPRRITTEPSIESRPSCSRDGRWIYFGSNRTGEWQVWKAPFEGGPAVQVTKQGGREAVESLDGKFLYYSKERGKPGIWRVPVEGGEEIQIIQEGTQGHWAAFEQGIVLLDAEANPGPAVKYYDFATGRLKPLTSLPAGTRIGSNPSFSVSPDGRWIVYGTLDASESDIMMVENFRSLLGTTR